MVCIFIEEDLHQFSNDGSCSIFFNKPDGIAGSVL